MFPAAGPFSLKRLALAPALAVLLATGCSGVRGELVESGYQGDDREQAELTFATDSGIETSMFSFEAMELYTGTPINGEDLHRNAPLIMTFVVPACPVCVVEAPKLGIAADANPDVNFVLIHSFGEVPNFLAYNDEANLGQENTVHLIDVDGTLWDRFGVLSQPSSILVDRDGNISSSRGALGDDGLARAISTITAS